MRIDLARVPRAVALLAWAAFFDWLWISGEAPGFVGSRTAWVVPFGGVVLTVAALAYLAGVRGGAQAVRPSAPELLGILALLAPILAVMAVPAPSLGALAVERKQSVRAASTPPPPPSESRVDLTTLDPGSALLSVSLADADPQYADTYGVYDGARVELLGLVSRQPVGPGAPFELARFQVSCCAADAIPFSVKVQPGPGLERGAYPLDAWLRVSGVVRRTRSGGYLVEATRARRQSEPRDPYMSGY